MNSMFQNLNVVEVLRLGISGLLFLFALFAYNLINREQKREGYPRQGIVRSIYVFMAVNCLGAVLVFLSSIFQQCDPAKLKTAEEQLRAEQAKVSQIKKVSEPLLNLRADVISQLPDDLPQKPILKNFVSELRRSLLE
jgi:hypothetical protein